MYRKKGPGGLTRVAGQIRDSVKQQFSRFAILAEEDYKREVNKLEPRKLVRLSLRNGKQETIFVDAKDYERLSDALDTIKNASKRDIDSSMFALQWQLSAYLESKIKPALIYDAARTEAKRREALATVGNVGEVSVKQGDYILKKSLIVRTATREKLRQEYRAVKAGMTVLERLKRLAGLATLAAGVLTAFFIVAGRVDPGIWSRRRALVMRACSASRRWRRAADCRSQGLSLAFAPFVFVGMAASLAFGQMVALLMLMA